MVRLQKFIANCGYTSRRRAELLILAGRVAVNGKTVKTLGATVDPSRDKVTVNGEEISLPRPLTIAFHKPAGLITSTHDTHDRLTVMDFLPKTLRERGVLPVGRLDRDTEGLLVLTNDGDLAHAIAHPRHETDKEYEAVVSGTPGAGAIAALETGVRVEGRLTAPARVLEVTPVPGGARVRLAIHEGRKRQVRRMFEAVGHPVLRLRRVRIAGVSLGDLPPGEWRELSAEEVRALAPEAPASPRSARPRGAARRGR